MVKKITKVLLVIVFFFLLLVILNNFYYDKKTNNNLEEYKKIVKKVETSNLPDEDIQQKIVNELSDSFENNDIVGTIKVDGTSIDDVFVKGFDNKYYLRHSLDKKYNVNGTIFMDYRNNLDDKKLIIYGHSYRYSNKGFSQLFSYEDKSFYEKNPYITLNIKGNISKWKIFSVMIIHYDDDKYIHTKLNFNEEEWLNHISWMKENSLYDTSLEVLSDDKILTVQTCYYKPANSYFIVNAKKIKEE